MPRSQRSASKRLKLPKKLNSSSLLIFIGITLFIFGAFRYYESRILSFNKPPNVPESVILGQKPAQITIPSLNIDLPIEEGSIDQGVWKVSYQNATYLDTSAPPKTGGNTVIYGHNKKAIFGSLGAAKIGENIYIKDTKGEVYVYEIISKEFVSPDRVDLVSPTSSEELTVYTCWGIFDSQRVVLKARPI